MEHWSHILSQRVLTRFPEEEVYTCAAGISPSGPVHIGNFRDIITSDFVFRSLQDRGVKTRLLFSWDDYDRLRKVPLGFPAEFKQYMGMPLSEVPDPLGEFESYAIRHQHQFEESLKQLGIFPEIRRQSEEYKSGRYVDNIRTALSKRIEIAKILANFKTQGMSDDQIENYYPVNIYSRFTGKDNTRVIAYDGENKLRYLCLDTKKEDELDLLNDRNLKLPWRVDWPMRWMAESVVFEPGGHDHASPAGSYDVGKIISDRIFARVAPLFQGYGFIGIKGLKGKMSGSTGEVITPKDLLEVYEPPMIRWFFARVPPEQAFDFAFDSDVFRYYSEFDRDVKNSENSGSNLAKRVLELSSSGTNLSLSRNPIPFRQVLGYGQVVDFDRSKLEKILNVFGEEYDLDTANSRLPRARNWLEKYNPGALIKLLDQPDPSYTSRISEEQREFLKKLRSSLMSSPNMDLAEIEALVYSIPKIPNATMDINKLRQREFFKTVYQLLFGKDTGPRLSTFLWAGDKERITELLEPNPK